MQRYAACFALLATLIIGFAAPASAQSGANVLVIANSDVAESVEIADYYASRRSIPADHVLRLRLTKGDEIPHPVYAVEIERPIAQWLASRNAYDRILYIVLTTGVPLRIAGTAGTTGTTASVDSELTLLYRRLLGTSIRLNGSEKNPYFLDQRAVDTATPFTHANHDIFLVSRLDGFTVADVKGLIDRAVSPSQNGVVLLERRVELEPTISNEYLRRAADAVEKLRASGTGTLNAGVATRPEEPPVLGYYSWGISDRSGRPARAPGIRFAPGAIGGMFVSGDARTMQSPPDTWRPGETEFAGSRQSLIGDLVRNGITGVAGQVAEGYLDSAIRPQILFPAYLSGFNLIESFYLAMPSLSWQTIVVGDPLTAPFRTRTIASAELDPPRDSITGLSQFFSDRRVTLAANSGGSRDARRYLVKADVRVAEKDSPGAIEALEMATKEDPSFDAAHFALGALYETADRVTDAVASYRRVIELKPSHAVALNNLAYVLAVRLTRPSEALPFAERAYSLSSGTPAIADTLGWIHHLLGDDTSAEPLLVGAAKGAPDSPEILVHAATVLAANGKSPEATTLLQRALTASPEFGNRRDVGDLIERLRIGTSK